MKTFEHAAAIFLASRNTYFLICLHSKPHNIKVYSGSLKARVICLKETRL